MTTIPQYAEGNYYNAVNAAMENFFVLATLIVFIFRLIVPFTK